jgi:hypothetical protein
MAGVRRLNGQTAGKHAAGFLLIAVCFLSLYISLGIGLPLGMAESGPFDVATTCAVAVCNSYNHFISIIHSTSTIIFVWHTTSYPLSAWNPSSPMTLQIIAPSLVSNVAQEVVVPIIIQWTGGGPSGGEQVQLQVVSSTSGECSGWYFPQCNLWFGLTPSEGIIGQTHQSLSAVLTVNVVGQNAPQFNCPLNPCQSYDNCAQKYDEWIAPSGAYAADLIVKYGTQQSSLVITVDVNDALVYPFC